MVYPHSTGYVKGSATSQASAQKLDESGAANSQAAYILAELAERGTQGATCDELTVWAEFCGFPHIHNGTVAGRLVHLEKLGKIIKTTQTRLTRSKRQAVVYALVGMGTPLATKPKPVAAATARQEHHDALEQAAIKQLARTLVRMMRHGKKKDGGALVDMLPLDVGVIESLAKQAGL